MRHTISITAAGLLMAGAPLLAETMTIPYSGGKKYGSVTITLDNGDAIAPDTLRIGSALTIIPYLAISPLAVCNNSHELGFQILPAEGASVSRHSGSDLHWVDYDAYPPSTMGSLVPADSVPVLMMLESQELPKAPGYVFARPGDLQCQTDTYHFVEDYDQILFAEGGGYYAKVQIHAFTQTLPGPPPPQYQPTILNTVSLRYVVSDDPEDLADETVSLHPARFRTGGAGRNGVEYYNPLGIRVTPEADRPGPALPVSRPRTGEASAR